MLMGQSAEDNFVVGVEVAVRPDRAAGKLRQQPKSKRGTTWSVFQSRQHAQYEKHVELDTS